MSVSIFSPSLQPAWFVQSGSDRIVANGLHANSLPGLERSPDGGSLICQYYFNPYYHFAAKGSYRQMSGTLIQRSSQDNGTTWSVGSPLRYLALSEYRNPELTRLSDGTYVLFAQQDYYVTSVTRTTAIVFFRGRWNSATNTILWKEPETIIASDATYNYSCATKLIEKNAVWYFCIYRWVASTGGATTTPVLAISEDRGATWQFHDVTANNANEASVEILSDGTVRVWTRSASLSYYDSADGGETFGAATDMTPTDWQQSKPNPLLMTNGEYFLAYRKGSSVNNADSYYVVSTGGGSAWGAPVVLQSGFFLYSSALLTDTGIEMVYAHSSSSAFDAFSITLSTLRYFTYP